MGTKATKESKKQHHSAMYDDCRAGGGGGGGVLFGESLLQHPPPVSSPSHFTPADRPYTQKSQCQRAPPRCSVTPYPPSLFCFHRQRAVPPSCFVSACSAAVDLLGCLFRVANLGRGGNVTSPPSRQERFSLLHHLPPRANFLVFQAATAQSPVSTPNTCISCLGRRR